MPNLTITDATGKVKYVRNWLHAFGAMHPFTLATFAAAAGFILAKIFS